MSEYIDKAALKHTDKRTETHVCDLIDRQAAIDAIAQATFNVTIGGRRGFQDYKEEFEKASVAIRDKYIEALESLPSAEPKIEKYEYHYDHTDCIWYRPEARNRCPATCAQYRDGWNDAMNYIFRDGKGYRPYRRDKQYGE